MSDESQNEPQNRQESGSGYKFDPSVGKATQFVPGDPRINRGGRPKKLRVTEIYEELLDDPGTREAIKEAMRARLLSGRMVGCLELKEAAERVEGKVTQPVDLTGDLHLSISERLDRARQRAGISDSGSSSDASR